MWVVALYDTFLIYVNGIVLSTSFHSFTLFSVSTAFEVQPTSFYFFTIHCSFPLYSTPWRSCTHFTYGLFCSWMSKLSSRLVTIIWEYREKTSSVSPIFPFNNQHRTFLWTNVGDFPCTQSSPSAADTSQSSFNSLQFWCYLSDDLRPSKRLPLLQMPVPSPGLWNFLLTCCILGSQCLPLAFD
jgi:hypothetical protein